jgi:hypothetical protein
LAEAVSSRALSARGSSGAACGSASGLDVVGHVADGHVAREVEALVVDDAVAHLTPAVFDDRAGLDGRHGERLGLDLEPARLDQVALEDVFLLQLDDLAARLDRAGDDILNLHLAAAELDGRDVDLAHGLAPALVEDLDADVVVEDGGRLSATVLVGDAHVPEEHLGVGVLLDDGRGGGEVGRVERLPVLVAAGGGARRRAEEGQQEDERAGRAGAQTRVGGLHELEPFGAE